MTLRRLVREYVRPTAYSSGGASSRVLKYLMTCASATLVLTLWLLVAGCSSGESGNAPQEEETTPETTSTESPNPIRLTGEFGDPRRGAPAFSISPDGKKVAFESACRQCGKPEIYVVSSDGTNLTNTPASGVEPIWSPDGEKIMFYRSGIGSNSDPGIYIMDSDGSNQTNLSTMGTPNIFSPDGKITFTSKRDGNFEIYTMNSDGTDQTNLTNNPEGADTDPSFSLDGKKIVFRNCPLAEGTCHFYVMNSDGTNQTLVANNVSATTPILSPDGEKIAFRHADQARNLKISVMDADGSNLTNLTDQVGKNVSQPVFLPDGRIAFVSNPVWDDEIYTINQDGTEQTNLTNDSAAHDGGEDNGFSFSSDGKKMAFLKAHNDESGNYTSEIYLMNLD